MQRMTSLVEQVIQPGTLFIECLWSLPDLEAADRSNFDALSTFIAVVDEVHESVDDTFHRSQEAFLLKTVVKWTGADVRSGYMRADRIESYVFLRQIFAI